MRVAAAFARPVASIAASYIARQRRRFLLSSVGLSDSQRSRLSPFFPSQLLDTVTVAKGTVPPPPLYPVLRKLGLSAVPDLSTIAGITFVDVIVHGERLSDALLFHELVHVVQYEVLGLKQFAEKYVRGFLSTGSYDDIPLEKQAYALGARFESHPRQPFSVRDEVLEWTRNGRF